MFLGCPRPRICERTKTSIAACRFNINEVRLSNLTPSIYCQKTGCIIRMIANSQTTDTVSTGHDSVAIPDP